MIVIGVGNAFRNDDGIGPAVIEWLRPRLPDGVRAIEQSGEGASLMESWSGAKCVVIVDAARSGSPAGTIHRLDAQLDNIPQEFFHYSTHAFSVAEAVELARALGTLPPKVILYGIEGGNFNAGQEISQEVEEAGRRVMDLVLQDLEQALTTSDRYP